MHGTSEGLGIQSIAHDLGKDLTLTVFADSSAAIGICNRSGIGRVRHLAEASYGSRSASEISP